MEKRAKQLEYLITSMILLGIGMLFFFMNESVNTYTVLRFGLFQIMQSVLLMICAILLWYRAYVVRREQETAEGGAETLGAAQAAPEEAGEEKREAKRDAVDSVNATMLLVVVTVLVVGFYLFTLKPREDVTGAVAPLHMVVCVVSFILYACVERWWSMQLDTNPDAASICNLMVLNKIAVAALMADMVTSFTGLFSVSQYVDYVILGCWFYVAAMAAVSVAVKMTRHREELVFRLYILFPVYYYGGQKGSGALTWLEQHTGISMRSLWSLKFIKMILPSCAMAVLLLVWLSTCVVQVETYQQGALYRFGSLAREDILEPGLHFKLPVPFEEVKIYNVTQPQGMIVGYEGDVNNKNNLWTRPHEGEYAVVTRFGAVRSEVTQAGMYLRLPWPFEDVQIQDARKRYLDSGYLETLTHDKKNVIMQTYTIWSIADPLRYYTSVGDTALAETYLSDLVTSAKNGTMGNYDLSALVSLDEEDIKIDEIEAAMLQEVQSHALEQYGIQVHELRLKRVGLPATNVQSVFTQMQADRQKYIDQLLAEGERDAQIIMSESDAEVAAIVAEGREEAAAINAETEREVAEIYASAHSQDPELYEFLQKLAALENSVDEDTVMIITMDTPPFDVLYGDD